MTTYAVQVVDRTGFDAHFIRFIYLTLYENEGLAHQSETHTAAQLFELVSLDMALLLGIIMPLFLLAMNFYTAPFKKRYRSKVQILVTPFALIPIFCFTNWDIVIMSVIVLLQNGYIGWYIID